MSWRTSRQLFSNMAKHSVNFQLPTRETGKVDAHFYIYKKEEKSGQVTIPRVAWTIILLRESTL